MHSVCGAMCVYVVFVCDCCWVKIAKKLYKRQRMTMTTHGNTLCISKQKKEKHFHPFGCDAHSLCVCLRSSCCLDEQQEVSHFSISILLFCRFLHLRTLWSCIGRSASNLNRTQNHVATLDLPHTTLSIALCCCSSVSTEFSTTFKIF